MAWRKSIAATSVLAGVGRSIRLPLASAAAEAAAGAGVSSGGCGSLFLLVRPIQVLVTSFLHKLSSDIARHPAIPSLFGVLSCGVLVVFYWLCELLLDYLE